MPEHDNQAKSEFPGRPKRPYYTVGVLAVVYALVFLDRNLPAVLAEPIKADLHLTDTQLSLLTGFAFALFYTTVGLVVGQAADRYNRTRIIAGSVALWSAFTAACGMAMNFAHFALGRIGVGVGESGAVPAAFSIISDLFPPEKRGLPTSVFMLGVPIGSMIAVTFVSWLAVAFGWRIAFVTMGGIGIAVAALIWLTVREPVRVMGTSGVDEAPIGFAATLKLCWTTPAIFYMGVAHVFAAFVYNGLYMWAPAMLMRTKGMALQEVGLYYGPLSAAGAIGGGLLSGLLVNHFASRRWIYPLIPAIAYLIMAPLIPLAALASGWHLALLYLTVISIAGIIKEAPSVAILHSLVGNRQRGTIIAIFVWLNSAIGLGFGPLFVGVVSDALQPRFGDNSLAFAVAALGPFALGATAAFYAASRALRSIAS